MAMPQPQALVEAKGATRLNNVNLHARCTCGYLADSHTKTNVSERPRARPQSNAHALPFQMDYENRDMEHQLGPSATAARHRLAGSEQTRRLCLQETKVPDSDF